MNKIMRLIFLWCLLLSVGTMMGQSSFSLSEAIDYAIQHSPEMQKQAINRADADHQIREYKSIGLPKVKGSVSYQYYIATPAQPIQDFITPSVYNVLFQENVIPRKDLGTPQTFKFSLFQPNQLSLGLDVNSMLFDGSYIYGLKAIKLLREMADKQKDVTEYSIKSQVIKAYVNVLMAKENLRIIDENLANLQNSINEVQSMYKEGFAEFLDVQRMELSINNLQGEKEKIHSFLAIGKNLLKYQMNYPASEEIEISDTLKETIKQLDVQVDADITSAIIKRPELTLFETSEALNDLNLKQMKAGYYPKVNGFASAGASLLRQNLFDNNETGFIPQALVGVSINVPIYDGGDRKAKMQRIKLTQEKTSLEKSEFLRAVNMQFMNSKSAWKSAKDNLELRRKSLDTAQSIYDKTLIKYKEGVGSSIEVIQAESLLLQAQSQFTGALYDAVNAGYEVQTVLGKI